MSRASGPSLGQPLAADRIIGGILTYSPITQSAHPCSQTSLHAWSTPVVLPNAPLFSSSYPPFSARDSSLSLTRARISDGRVRFAQPPFDRLRDPEPVGDEVRQRNEESTWRCGRIGRRSRGVGAGGCDMGRWSYRVCCGVGIGGYSSCRLEWGTVIVRWGAS